MLVTGACPRRIQCNKNDYWVYSQLVVKNWQGCTTAFGAPGESSFRSPLNPEPRWLLSCNNLHNKHPKHFPLPQKVLRRDVTVKHTRLSRVRSLQPKWSPLSMNHRLSWQLQTVTEFICRAAIRVCVWLNLPSCMTRREWRTVMLGHLRSKRKKNWRKHKYGDIHWLHQKLSLHPKVRRCYHLLKSVSAGKRNTNKERILYNFSSIIVGATKQYWLKSRAVMRWWDIICGQWDEISFVDNSSPSNRLVFGFLSELLLRYSGWLCVQLTRDFSNGYSSGGKKKNKECYQSWFNTSHLHPLLNPWWIRSINLASMKMKAWQQWEWVGEFIA